MEGTKITYLEGTAVFEDLTLGQIRATVHEDGTFWFCMNDVLQILEIGKDAKASSVKRLDESELSNDTFPTPGGPQNFVTISEGGLYFFICTSRKPKAKMFRLWVTNVVLTRLRENNGYAMGEETLPEAEQERIAALHRENSTVKHNPMNFDRAYVAKDGTVFTDWASCVEYNRELWN